MTRTVVILGIVISMTALSGCYVEPGHGTAVDFDGNFTVAEGEFTMEGHVELAGGVPTEDAYSNVTLEFYGKDGTVLYKEQLGTLDNQSDQLNVSVSLSTVPYYIIIDSPDFWNGDTTVDYYVRSEEAHQGYQIKTADQRNELPITPEG